MAGARYRHPGAARAVALPLGPARTAQTLPPPQRPAIGQPGELHLHFHGVTAEDVAAAIRHVQGQMED